MAQLAIKAHKTRGKEVIALLEMLGGINDGECNSYSSKSIVYYFIKDNYIDWCHEFTPESDFICFTLEEFFKKYPYKVGDKVIVIGLPEYPKNINFMKWFDSDIHYSFDNETWFLPSALNLYKEETMNTKIAIKGHKTRGKEVIEILEMLGGQNDSDLIGNASDLYYYINNDNKITYVLCEDINDFKIFTVEEFLEKYPYKVGDKVNSKYLKNYKIEKMEWEDTNNRVIYKLQGMGWYNTSELQPYKEETVETMKEKIEGFEILESHCANEVKIEFDPSKFEMVKRDNGYYVVKKQPQYPKTYEECCRIVNANPCIRLAYDNRQKYSYDADNLQHYENIRKLLICRDAYWKVAGEQMRLNKSWKPNWSNDLSKYYISFYNNKVDKGITNYSNKILVFPIEEMHDAFYSNFKELIEQCKELL